MVSIDLFQNETTRHANFILPTTFGLERDHFDIAFNALAVRNTVKYAEAIFAPAGDTRDDFDVLADLAARIGLRGGTMKQRVWGASARTMRAIGLKRITDGLLRTGPHRLSIAALKASPHGVDLGALGPRLPAALATTNGRIQLAPKLYQDALAKLGETLAARKDAAEAPRDPGGAGELALIGRRSLRSNNSWMHNARRLVKGPLECTLMMHPDDAKARALASGELVCIRSRVGELAVALEITAEVAPGVVSLPHGWGHDREGVKLAVARAHGGVSVNDLTDDAMLDSLTATAGFSGVPVHVSRAPT